uniref:Putative CHASE domain protein n=1 Tax=uncultured marine microorganism HF4000_APKG2J17 TaxID=455546 RepID=B3T6K2_9ZZZZ|nr:putative CHASE domain protein [uncultured marine microorganism HF4000_APKG2J17]
MLSAIGAFYRATNEVTRRDFHTFTNYLLGKSNLTQALEWIPRVPAVARTAMEAAARSEGLNGFQFTERSLSGKIIAAGERAEYFPVYFLNPLAGNEPALGFDLASNPTRLEAIRKAKNTGKLIVSGRIKLVQETTKQFGVLAFLPIYRNGRSIETLEKRRKNLVGFALSVIRIGELVKQSLSKEPRFKGLSVTVIDASAQGKDRILYPYDRDAEGSANLSDAILQMRTGSHQWFDIPFGDRTWSVIFKPAPGIPSEPGPWLVFGLESVRKVYAFKQSFLIIRRIDAKMRKARAVLVRFSKSLARRRHLPSQANVLSTTHLLGMTSKPIAVSDRLTISVSKWGKIFFWACSKTGP